MIGAGGMAQVFEAVRVGERDFERRVALKRILPQAVHDAAIRNMFLDEARIVSGLHHANIVQVFDYGTIDDSEFLVLELIDGMDAERLARTVEGGVPVAVALHIIQQIAYALAYAHDAEDEHGRCLDIVHRDVTPQNILLSWSGDVKLSDFGIAMARGRQVETTVGVVKGKLAYLAPEQKAGQPATGRTDVYALGQTLHRLLEGQTASTESPDASLRGVEPDVRELLRAMLHPTPESRPDASEVAARAASLLHERSVPDGRGELVALLGSLRPQSDVTRALDEVVALVIAPVTDDGREFTAERPTEPTRAGRRDDVAASEDVTRLDVASAPARAASAPVQAKRKGRHGWVLGAGVLLVGAAGLTAGWAWRERSPSPVAPGALRAAAGPSVTTTAPPAEANSMDTGDDPDGPPTEPAPSPTAPPAPSSAVRSERRPAPRRARARAAAASTPPPAPSPEPTVGRGTLLVAGRSLHGGDVFIDGRRHAQSVPTSPVALPAGAHRVEVRDPASGEVWLSREVDVVAQREVRVSAGP